MGQAVNFVFLHGGGRGGWIWDEAVAALRLQADGQDLRTLQLDVPGSGRKRARDISEIGMQDIAAELIADIEAAGLTEVVLVGHAHAGQFLPIIAALRPDLVRRLVYIACIVPIPGKTIDDLMGNDRFGTRDDQIGWVFDPRTETLVDNLQRMFANDMCPEQATAFALKLGVDRWPPSTYAMRDWRYDHIGRIAATYVVCLRDNILPPPWQERFAAQAGAKRVLQVDAGHQVMNTRPHALAEILLQEAGC